METSTLKVSTIESELLEARDILRKSVNSLESLVEKVHGPRPSDSTTAPEGPPCLRSLVSDVRELSMRIVNELADHHTVLGFDRSNQAVVGRAVGR